MSLLNEAREFVREHDLLVKLAALVIGGLPIWTGIALFVWLSFAHPDSSLDQWEMQMTSETCRTWRAVEMTPVQIKQCADILE